MSPTDANHPQTAKHQPQHEHGCQHDHSHEATVVTRRFDVVVVGGSAAGLAAALQLARSRRSVVVVDAGAPRNAPAAHMHSYLGYDGCSPETLLRVGREEVRSYGAEILTGQVVELTGEQGNFTAKLDHGTVLKARRIVLATGLVDELPDIDGLREQWGRGVIHCPFCHGYEVRDQHIVLIATSLVSLHQALMFRALTDRLTVVLHDGVAAGADQLEPLRRRGVTIIDQQVKSIDTDNDRVRGVTLANGEQLTADVVACGGFMRARAEVAATLGVTAAQHQSTIATAVQTSPTGETDVAGVFAAGNVTDPSAQVLQAAAAGSLVGGMVHASMLADDAVDGADAPARDWNERYGEQIWSGNPNGSLVNEARDLAPGRALDLGAGEGADALWLAEQGWQVTAIDISAAALHRGQTEAERRSLDIDWVAGDANRIEFGADRYDLVSWQYPSVPRTADRRTLRRILNSVSPGGTLLVVGHAFDELPERMSWDPFAYEQPDPIAEFLAGGDCTEEGHGEWRIERHERVDRPRGHINDSHHHNDIILRATRQF